MAPLCTNPFSPLWAGGKGLKSNDIETFSLRRQVPPPPFVIPLSVMVSQSPKDVCECSPQIPCWQCQISDRQTALFVWDILLFLYRVQNDDCNWAFGGLADSRTEITLKEFFHLSIHHYGDLLAIVANNLMSLLWLV